MPYLARVCCYARDELGLDLHDALFIGDSITDVPAGLAAGIATVLVLTGLGEEQLHQHYHGAEGPFHITTDLGQAVEMILRGSLPSADQQVPAFQTAG